MTPYSVYVVELEPEGGDEGSPAVYVGCTGLDPEERFTGATRKELRPPGW